MSIFTTIVSLLSRNRRKGCQRFNLFLCLWVRAHLGLCVERWWSAQIGVRQRTRVNINTSCRLVMQTVLRLHEVAIKGKLDEQQVDDLRPLDDRRKHQPSARHERGIGIHLLHGITIRPSRSGYTELPILWGFYRSWWCILVKVSRNCSPLLLKLHKSTLGGYIYEGKIRGKYWNVRKR